jgi:hypothetical protein
MVNHFLNPFEPSRYLELIQKISSYMDTFNIFKIFNFFSMLYQHFENIISASTQNVELVFSKLLNQVYKMLNLVF